MPLLIEPATPADQAAIVALVRSERLNPNGLHSERFIVARDGGRIVGAVQMRAHGDGSRELGSLVVAPSHRSRGLAGHMIKRLLAEHPGPIFLITKRANTLHWVRFGFAPIPATRAPLPVRVNVMMGSVIGGLFHLAHRRRPQRLVVLKRDAVHPASPIVASRVSPAKTSAT